MDIPRKSAARNRRIRRAIYSILAVVIIAGITLALRQLRPAAPSVEWGTIWPDTVKRGPMLRQVHGLGTLVPTDIRWIPAVTQGRVERRLVQQGDVVKPETILLDLSNPDLEKDTINAEWDYKSAEAGFVDLKVRLDSAHLNQEASAAQVESDYIQAKMKFDANDKLFRDGLVDELTLRISKVTAEQLEGRIKIDKKRLEIDKESMEAQLAVQRAKIAQLKAIYQLKRSQLDQLRVRAGVSGVLTILQVEVGAQVAPGANLARVADPKHLKAELKIAETQAKDIQLGQVASIDTRNGIIPGRVIRKDPTAQNGTVTVDVSLVGELPKGAVPDLSVDGTITLERLEDVLYVGRPVQGQQDSLISLFKVDPDGKGAVRIQVKLGRASVSTIEVREGLKVGDTVVLSDMSAMDGFERIRFNR